MSNITIFNNIRKYSPSYFEHSPNHFETLKALLDPKTKKQVAVDLGIDYSWIVKIMNELLNTGYVCILPQRRESKKERGNLGQPGNKNKFVLSRKSLEMLFDDSDGAEMNIIEIKPTANLPTIKPIDSGSVNGIKSVLYKIFHEPNGLPVSSLPAESINELAPLVISGVIELENERYFYSGEMGFSKQGNNLSLDVGIFELNVELTSEGVAIPTNEYGNAKIECIDPTFSLADSESKLSGKKWISTESFPQLKEKPMVIQMGSVLDKDEFPKINLDPAITTTTLEFLRCHLSISYDVFNRFFTMTPNIPISISWGDVAIIGCTRIILW